MYDFQGKVASVTGAARGIGRTIALELAANGCDVYLADLNREGLEQTKQECQVYGVRVGYAETDVSSESDVRTLFKKTIDELGSLDILINNAGILADKNIGDISVDEFDRMLDIHMRGTFLTCREALPIMMKKGYGRIVNMSSLGARQGVYLAGSHYCGAKGGIAAFTRQLAQQVQGMDIVVNCVAPGTIMTEMTSKRDPEILKMVSKKFPLGRLGLPAEIGGAVLFLASDWARCITGESIDINGGKMMS